MVQKALPPVYFLLVAGRNRLQQRYCRVHVFVSRRDHLREETEQWRHWFQVLGARRDGKFVYQDGFKASRDASSAMGRADCDKVSAIVFRQECTTTTSSSP